MPNPPHLRQIAGGSLRLDRLDIKILVALQADGRMTNLKLAEVVGLSPTPCLQRVRRMEAAGYIRAYEASLDAARLAAHMVVFTQVTLASHRYEDARRFERYAQASPYVMECHGVGGGFDYLIKSVARNVAHHQEMLDELVSEEVGVKQVASFISLKTLKDSRQFPLTQFDPGLQVVGGLRSRA